MPGSLLPGIFTELTFPFGRGILVKRRVKAVTKAEKVVQKLTQRNWRISFAESCTGGLAAAELVSIASASSVFDQSFVTYADEAKVALLGVDKQAIASFGVVSDQVALQMAVGTAARTGAQVAVGISGIAGPTGAVPGKPVGMVCFGFVIGEERFAVTKQFGNIGRNAVRAASVEFVYDTLAEKLK